jgi:hypothetical protein
LKLTLKLKQEIDFLLKTNSFFAKYKRDIEELNNKIQTDIQKNMDLINNLSEGEAFIYLHDRVQLVNTVKGLDQLISEINHTVAKENRLFQQVIDLQFYLNFIKKQYTILEMTGDDLNLDTNVYTKTPEVMACKFWLFINALIKTQPELKYLYIHNMNFDLQYLLPSLHRIYDLKVTMKDHKFKKVGCYLNGEHLFSIHCSFNKTGVSLRNSAEGGKFKC